MKKIVYFAFTLAEIMIVLVVIGVLTAIMLPVALNSAPDENIMKFKKANNTLGAVVRELVNLDRYYANGDLGVRADGTLIDNTHEGDATYFCETLGDVLSIKSKNCSSSTKNGECGGLDTRAGYHSYGYTIEEAQVIADNCCKTAVAKIGAELVTSDGVTYYQTTPGFTFGYIYPETGTRYFGAQESIAHSDANGFGAMYKIFCIDVDGIEKGEDPFGYGIRADGKIFPGKRANEWINKSVQNKD